VSGSSAAEPAHVPEPVQVLGRRAAAEFLGTALLLGAVVGSGIAAQRLSPNDVGLQLLENSIATAAALVAVILTFGPISGAHLNPVVTLADRLFGGVTTGQAAAYIAAQIIGGAVGTITANLMFSLPAAQWSTKPRSSPGLWLGEVVATFGLLLVIFGIVRSMRPTTVPFAVGAYIGAAYWWTSSTSFANPAATLARTLTDSFTGIDPGSVLPFIGAELLGAVLAVAAIAVLYPRVEDNAPDVLLPHPTAQVAE
jgi:glycerol uptake facilitator-like aquaporin